MNYNTTCKNCGRKVRVNNALGRAVFNENDIPSNLVGTQQAWPAIVDGTWTCHCGTEHTVGAR